MSPTSRRKYLYVPLQIVDVCCFNLLSKFNFYVSKRILWLKSLGITGLKSCVTVLLTVMRTNVLLFAGFWSVWSYIGTFPTICPYYGRFYVGYTPRPPSIQIHNYIIVWDTRHDVAKICWKLFWLLLIEIILCLICYISIFKLINPLIFW